MIVIIIIITIITITVVIIIIIIFNSIIIIMRRWRKCSGCRDVFYCSSRCQRLDWRDGHVYECVRRDRAGFSMSELQTWQPQGLVALPN
eukprot:7847439-Karenia_brevis.AAC.1